MPPKLTPEERKQLQEQFRKARILAILEAKKKLKRDELARELKYGEISRKKLEEGWKQMLIDIKMPAIKIEIQLGINELDRVLDTKDYTISLLLDELDEAEEQYNINFRKHCENIQSLYNTYLLRLHEIKKGYDEELTCFHHSLHQQLGKIRSESDNAEVFIKTMSYGLGVQEKYLENLGRSLYMSKQNEQESKNRDETNLKRKKCEDLFEHVWRSYTNYLENYLEQIKETEKDYEERIARDALVVKIIRKQTEDIFQQVNLLRIMKERQVVQKETIEIKMKTLKSERDFMQNIFLTLKQMLTEDVKYDEKILTNLVLLSNAEIKELKSSAELAEKILILYSIIRKFETRREKILPFPKTMPRKDKHEGEWKNMKPMCNFWQKCAMADMARNNVKDEYLHLLEENYYLKSTVKSCINYNCNRKAPALTIDKKKLVLGKTGGSASDIVYHL